MKVSLKPVQSYYDMSATGQGKAIGDRDDSLGIVGYSLDKEIMLHNEEIRIPFIIDSNTKIPDLNISDIAIAVVNKKAMTICGVANGTTKLLVSIPCGNNMIQLESKVIVNGIQESKPIVPEGISLNKSTIDISEGDHFQLIASISPSNALTNIHWTSDNENIVMGSANGYITAIASGEANIHVRTDNHVEAVCHVIVKQREIPITSVSISNTSLSLVQGQDYNISATIHPSNTTMGKVVRWYSQNPEVAQIDSNGKIQAVSIGNATIIAESINGKRAECSIHVQKKEVPPVSPPSSETPSVPDTTAPQVNKKTEGFYQLSRRVRIFSSPNASKYYRYDPFKRKWLGNIERV